MGKAKKSPKFAVMKKIVTHKAIKQYKEDVLNPNRKDLTKEKLPRNVPQVSSSLYFKHNTALGPPYRLDLEKAMMDCLYAKCTPCITDCVMAELEKLGQKYRVALRHSPDRVEDDLMGFTPDWARRTGRWMKRVVEVQLQGLSKWMMLCFEIAKDPRFERLPCIHKGTYADDCLVDRVTQHKCYIVATCDRDLKRRIRKIPGVPIMYITKHQYSIERLPEATIGGGRINHFSKSLKLGSSEVENAGAHLLDNHPRKVPPCEVMSELMANGACSETLFQDSYCNVADIWVQYVSASKRLQAAEMMSLMSSSNDARVVPPLQRGRDTVEEEKIAGSASEISSSGAFEFGAVVSNVEAGRVGYDESDEARFITNVSDSRVAIENDEFRFNGSGGGENKPSSSVCRLLGGSEKSILQSGKLEHRKNTSAAEDYDSILSASDKFAAKGNDEAVGHGFQIGDMVWGKVKSHPWWPGHIYNEALVPRSVRRGKQEGHVLVAFFGDSSYGWFDPAELIPFEENFAEKSMQTTSRSFLKAVEEAADEIATRSSLGLACRCKNQFSPSSVEGYVVVDNGDSEAGVYSLSQISKAHDSFRPSDIVSFVHQVALNPMSDERFSVDFIKQKALALAVRKMRFEDFDETYAQAFGTQPLRPSCPTAPATMDPSTGSVRGELLRICHGKSCFIIVISQPLLLNCSSMSDMTPAKSLFPTLLGCFVLEGGMAVPVVETAAMTKEKDNTKLNKAPLSGRLVFAEILGKKEISVKPAKAKGQVEKDKYLSRRQEESIPLKSKKASSSQVGHFPRPFSVNRQYSSVRDHMHQPSESCSTEYRHQPISQQAPIYMKPSDSSRKDVEGGTKKVEFLKRPAGKSTDNNAIRVKKEKRKVINPDTGGERQELPLAVRNITENVSGMPARVHPSENSGPDDQNIDAAVGLSSSQSQQADDFVKIELQMFVRDLRAVACNPFHGEQKSCQAVIKQVFLKYRSLVYQKSLVVVPPAEIEGSEGNPSRLPVPMPAVADKIVRPSVRLDDPTKGGKKHDRPDDVQKMKLRVSQGVKRKKLNESLESKRNKIDSSKSLTVEKKELDESLESKKKKMDSSKSLTVEKKELDEFLESKRKKMDSSNKSLTVEKKELDESLESKRKKMDSSKSLTLEKKVIIQRSSESQFGDARDSAPQIRAAKQESNRRTAAGQMTRSATPTMLMMKFPADAALPSIPQLKAKFARFGPLDQSATRVFWKSYMCRLVYQHKIDAQAALKFAVGSSNLLGSANVRCYIREVDGEGAESEPVKAPHQNKEDTEQRPVVAKTASEQFRSCLKKPSGDEAGNGDAVKSARVKFVLGGDDSSLPLNENNINKIASFGAGSSSIHSTSKDLPNINPQSSNTFAPPFRQLPVPEQGGIRPPALKMAPGDISQQMLSLLTRCNDVVNNLSAALGCVPYHPL
ncbi:hypothetical protein SASPL_105918 [Salvia splendens]|uniref:PWWP domain-containing protein n=2 Tax=Magnoliopsida TaxID=3398 RepID=A0A8X9AC14_SALSN|nr:hypothetical protein SASPL_105918 [Salvia splendens]